MASLDKMSPPSGKEGISNFKNRTNYAGMSLKTKDRCGKLGREPGMSMKTKVLRPSRAVMLLKRKAVSWWEVVGGELRTGTGGWGRGNEGLPATGACQHHSLDLSCGSRKPTNPEKGLFF
jgi:hypothetical protein